jgi:ankyrin repeat protein
MSQSYLRRSVWAILLAGFAVAAASPWSEKPASVKRQQPSAKKEAPPVFHTGKLGQELFLAIDHRDTAEVRALLKRGANPNSRNALRFTPLHLAAASHQPDVVDALIAAGADPSGSSSYGTPLTFAAATGNLEGATRLLALHAKADVSRADGNTPLMMAANAGNPAVVAELIKHKADVNVKNITNATALSYAARAGHVAVVRVLLDAGATVDVADDFGQTPLMVAAGNGHAEVVQLLLQKGAKVDLRDTQKRTPLILAASYGDYPEVVRALLQNGADAKAKDAEGRTAGDIAVAREYTGAAELLGAPMAPARIRTSDEAVTAALTAIQKSSTLFGAKAACISCHQEGLGRMATGAAQARGFKLDPNLVQMQQTKVREMLMAMRPLHEQAAKNPEVMKELPLIEINEVSPVSGWMLAGMAAQGDPAHAATAAAAKVLALQQTPDGAWTFSLPRIPMQSSNFTVTALAARSLSVYAPRADAADVASRLERAKRWLLRTPAQTGDDRAFRLLGLKWTGAGMDERRKAIDELLAAQNADGGWSQVPGMKSDAYATGQALYALRVGGGESTSSSAYEKGTQFLLRTQDRDGSWFVSKRAIPVNNYFDGGFPHGESQYASFNATCWATMALVETLDKR